MLANTAQGLYNQRFSRPNFPVLDAWAKLYVQTALVLLGAYFRPRIRRRALRAPSLDPRFFPNVALRAVRLSLVELTIIVTGMAVLETTFRRNPLSCLNELRLTSSLNEAQDYLP